MRWFIWNARVIIWHARVAIAKLLFWLACQIWPRDAPSLTIKRWTLRKVQRTHEAP